MKTTTSVKIADNFKVVLTSFGFLSLVMGLNYINWVA